MLTEAVIAATASFALMLAAYYWHQVRWFHVPAMGAVILFDLAMPVYLVLTRDWGKRLIEEGDILSFGVWMHFGLIISLYVLYVIQIQAGLKLSNPTAEDADTQRQAHRAQAKGILLVRALVLATGAILAEAPDATP